MNILSHLNHERFRTMATAQPDRTGSTPRKNPLGSVQARVVPFLLAFLKFGTDAGSVEPDKVGGDTAEQRDARSFSILCQWPIGYGVNGR